MGMAASQARLLSITSRMADNELRSQVINNAKMRLATESSQASEEYIDALNSATMMISNYDTDGDSVYQALTFNALTAYSSYNNQYGLVNSYGQILVSEQEGKFFEDAKGDLDTYLAYHGLEYTTTYFDTLSETYGDTYELAGGSYDIDELEAMYFGNTEDGGIHAGYETCLSSAEYINYSDYSETLALAYSSYYDAVYDEISDEIFNDSSSKWTYSLDSKKYTWDWSSISYPSDISTADKAVSDISNLIEYYKSEGKISEGSNFYNNITALISEYNTIEDSNTSTISFELDMVANSDGTYSVGESATGSSGTVYMFTLDSSGNLTYNSDYWDLYSSSVDASEYYTTPTYDNNGNLTYQYWSDSDSDGTADTYTTYTVAYDSTTGTVTRSRAKTDDDIVEAAADVYDYFKSAVISGVNFDAFATASASDAKTAYYEAYAKMLQFVFGEEAVSLVYDTTTDPATYQSYTVSSNSALSKYESELSANYSTLLDMEELLQFINTNGLTYSDEFQSIIDIYVLDSLFDTYGEPAEGWVDVNNASENAEAKAQWYTNLFNRMLEGYKVLEDGLASSNEWIQFALESGLVTMEQVDNTNVWNSTVYSNCSDITEVTDNTAVAKAEAVYNKAMNTIESKDNRYDIELKNIDTEHTSLETEYDSVKSVIDKNIERSFKMYS